MCRVLREENSLLSFPAFGETGNHRLGAGQLSLRRKRRGRDRKTEVRSLLYSSLFSQARRDDRAQDRACDALQQGPLSQLSELLVKSYWRNREADNCEPGSAKGSCDCLHVPRLIHWPDECS